MSEKKLVVAVVGATGAVGREMLKTLESRNFPATEVVPFASARSAGTKVPYGDSELVVREPKEDFEVRTSRREVISSKVRSRPIVDGVE